MELIGSGLTLLGFVLTVILVILVVLLLLAFAVEAVEATVQWWADVRVLWLQLRLTYTKWRLDRATTALATALTQARKQAGRDMAQAARNVHKP